MVSQLRALHDHAGQPGDRVHRDPRHPRPLQRRLPACEQHARLHPLRQRDPLDRDAFVRRPTARSGSARATRPTTATWTRSRFAHVRRAELRRQDHARRAATGSGLPGHPFCPADANLTHVCTKHFAKGFRNPFRFQLRPGGLIVGDVGWNTREEIDLLRLDQPGKSYGWPCYEGTIQTPGYKDGPECAAEYAKPAGHAPGARPRLPADIRTARPTPARSTRPRTTREAYRGKLLRRRLTPTGRSIS